MKLTNKGMTEVKVKKETKNRKICIKKNKKKEAKLTESREAHLGVI